MISPTQMRAARAMLDVSQGIVADKLGIAANTLSKIESGQSDIPMSRNAEIQQYYQREGIAFTENDGVKWTQNIIHHYEGENGIQSFFDDVYEEAKLGCNISLFNGVPELLIKWLGKDFYEKHALRMKELPKISFRIIVEDSEMNYIASTFAEYRQFPKSLFSNKTIYIYGNKVGFFSFEENNVFIDVIVNKELAESMTVLFNIAWDKVAVSDYR